MNDYPVACPECEERASKFIKNIIKRGHESVLEHANATFLLVTDRGLSHEIVRHRIGVAYSQESSRYCNYGNKGGEITVIRPTIWYDRDWSTPEYQSWKLACETAETEYLQMLVDVQPQWARSVLPTCLKTEIAMTANFRAWRHILSLRATNKRAHPQIRLLMKLVLDKLQDCVPAVFDDIQFEE